MVDPPPEQLEAACVRVLRELGLTEYESHVFVTLIRLGTGTAKDIADLSEVPRTGVYDAVDTLHDAGLVDIQYTSPRKFTAISRETAIRNSTWSVRTRSPNWGSSWRTSSRPSRRARSSESGR